MHVSVGSCNSWCKAAMFPFAWLSMFYSRHACVCCVRKLPSSAKILQTAIPPGRTAVPQVSRLPKKEHSPNSLESPSGAVQLCRQVQVLDVISFHAKASPRHIHLESGVTSQNLEPETKTMSLGDMFWMLDFGP